MAKRNPKQIAYEKLVAQRTIKYQSGSDSAYGTCDVADAEVILDLVLTDWLTKLAPGADYEDYVRMNATLRALKAHAIKLAISKPRQRIKGCPRTWLNHGVMMKRHNRWSRYDYAIIGEDNFLCLFCKYNIATLAVSAPKITNEIQAKISRHVNECAMRYLLEIIK